MAGVKELWRSLLALRSRTSPFGILAFSFTLAVIIIFSVGVTAESNQKPACKIAITADGGTWEYVSSQETVGLVLNEAGIALGAKDIVKPALGSTITNGMKVRIIRITEKTVTQKEPIAFSTITQFDPSSHPVKNTVQKGENGEKEIDYLITYKDGKKTGYKVLSAKIIKHPIDEIVTVSRGTILASRSGSYYRSLTMTATGYDPGPRSCGKYADGYTATGMKAGKGVAAVDPRYIKLGTKLYVEGYGFCIAADTGGAIKGARIDLCFDTYSEALRYGRKKVKVYILD